MEVELDSDCEEIGVENKSCNVNIKNCSGNNRVFFGEVTTPNSGPGADLEYDLWEGQFQFLGYCPLRDQTPQQNCPSASDEQVRNRIIDPSPPGY